LARLEVIAGETAIGVTEAGSVKGEPQKTVKDRIYLQAFAGSSEDAIIVYVP